MHNFWSNPIPTYGGDTVLNIPLDEADAAKQLQAIGDSVMGIQFEAEQLSGEARDQQVIDALKQLEVEQQ